ncbi:MAG: class II fructose-1,6-bisphosphate aldolase [Christensenellaceae bacterium]|jgi:fructose-bisphosphate aldolase class II|nr:class II fructose-1,6-bisphosphate aldolase [Christensenellaceae bacterium]
MKIVSSKELLILAKKRNRAICAFNVNNMELIQAITSAADETKTGVILQASAGAVKYAGITYIRKLVEAAAESISVPVALHLDHGDSFEACKMAVDGGFTSVMIDGSHLPFEDNIKLTKKVVDYAHKKGVSVEGELGQIAGVEDEVSAEHSHYTDPAMAREFVEKTGVDSLAVSIGTAHGAFKYKSAPKFAFDVLEQIQKEIPNTPLVLHGASSVVPEAVATINKFGGKIENAMGVSEETLAKSIPLGVRKINIDSDLRLVFTATLREYFAKNPAQFDPRGYLKEAREQVKQLVIKKLKVFSV